MIPRYSSRAGKFSSVTWSAPTHTSTMPPRTLGVPPEQRSTRTRAMKKAGRGAARERSSTTTRPRALPPRGATRRSTIPRPGRGPASAHRMARPSGTIPWLSSPTLGFELGPSLRLHDGRIFQIGATQHTALYNPTTNTWVAGPRHQREAKRNPISYGARRSLNSPFCPTAM